MRRVGARDVAARVSIARAWVHPGMQLVRECALRPFWPQALLEGGVKDLSSSLQARVRPGGEGEGWREWEPL